MIRLDLVPFFETSGQNFIISRFTTEIGGVDFTLHFL